MTSLPLGWVKAPLAIVADVQLGRQRSPKNHVGPNMRPYLRAANVTWDGLALQDVKEMNFSPKEFATFRLMPGDLLLSEASGSASEVGKPAMWRGEIEDCCFQNTLLRVRTRHVQPIYLLWFFKWLALSGKFARGSRGVGIHHLGARALSEWSVPVPPRREQERIVAAIEEHVSRVDAGALVLRHVRQKLKNMRAAVLQDVVVRSRAAAEELPLGDVLREPLRNGHSAKADPNGTVPILTLTAVTFGDFSKHNLKMTAADPGRVNNLWLQPGDLLIERSNTRELVGTSRLYRGPSNLAIFPDLVIRARVNARILPEYAELVLQAPSSRRYFQRSAQGISGSMPKIDQSVVESLLIPIPPIELQNRLVTNAARQLTLTEAAEDAVSTAAQHSSALLSSILAAAFCGKLVPQDPRDEPASILLERIAIERAASNGLRRSNNSGRVKKVTL